jgi:hypothetical protein
VDLKFPLVAPANSKFRPAARRNQVNPPLLTIQQRSRGSLQMIFPYRVIAALLALP